MAYKSGRWYKETETSFVKARKTVPIIAILILNPVRGNISGCSEISSYSDSRKYEIVPVMKKPMCHIWLR
jgi:hypothetical protein